jgi:threonine dehydratase
MYRSLESGTRVQLDHVGMFADGVAVNQVGKLPFALCRDAVDEIVRVTDDHICGAIRDIFEDTRTVVEPAGALGVAGAKAWLTRNASPGHSVVAIVSGANMNFDGIRFVADRAGVLSREPRQAY